MRLVKTEAGVQQIFSGVELQDFHSAWCRLEQIYGKLHLHEDYYLELCVEGFGVVLSYVPSTKMLHIPYCYTTYVLPENRFKYYEFVLPCGTRVYKKKYEYV